MYQGQPPSFSGGNDPNQQYAGYNAQPPAYAVPVASAQYAQPVTYVQPVGGVAYAVPAAGTSLLAGSYINVSESTANDGRSSD